MVLVVCKFVQLVDILVPQIASHQGNCHNGSLDLQSNLSLRFFQLLHPFFDIIRVKVGIDHSNDPYVSIKTRTEMPLVQQGQVYL